MGEINLIFAVHNHQPVGNFENVFEEAYEKCYNPFLKIVEKNHWFRVVLHYSGPLIDWIKANRPDFISRLASLVARGQVELLSSGYYEPILMMIPREDAVGQLKMMNQFIFDTFKQTPKGFWLTERIWEPNFPSIAREAGLLYTAIDDTHFRYAGLDQNSIRDVYVTEDHGNVLWLYPIDKELRYTIPFKEPKETIDYLRNVSALNDKPVTITIGDDGEKFGVWPGTYKWVYEEKWFERFLKALKDNSSWLKTKTFSEVTSEITPLGKVYLPTSSYEEMNEWALKPSKAKQFEDLKQKIKDLGIENEAEDFIRSGFFRNFIAKYSEAENMVAKMRYVSRKVNSMPDGGKKRKALKELWQGQCNCPYWHGIFGGLYLHHLRRATYQHLLNAEKIADSGKFDETAKMHRVETLDFNSDGSLDIVLESEEFSFVFKPNDGATLTELDYKPESFNLLDTMTRREEFYHKEILENPDTEQINVKGASIHEMVKHASPEVRANLYFDITDRRSLRDRILPKETSFGDFKTASFEKMGEISTGKYVFETKSGKTGTTILFSKDSKIYSRGKWVNIEVKKEFSLSAGGEFKIAYCIKNNSKERLDLLFGTELNFNFKCEEHKCKDLSEYVINDEWSRLSFVIKTEKNFDMWLYPIKTVSQTEKDFVLSDQGSCAFPHWNMKLPAEDKWEAALSFDVKVR